MTGLSFLRPDYGKELLIVLNVLPILGPSNRMTAMTTMATRARMIAYSTRPWPFSLGANNIITFLSIKIFCLRTTLSAGYMTVSKAKGYIGLLQENGLCVWRRKHELRIHIISKLPNRQNLINS